ncbi:Serine/threonine-protein phosphatase 2A regulatory subunit B'' subunit alpha isoform X3 [Oopsacas minuta]|uniref:Serine/threonine-protein phosphatase 2A regulatory subunit B'' subunit alpha isoform X3 n=1 Tax=Oopsacas minuta TaxID=111878 RepID=A0AAV7JKL3_9METZ|nr:Serine/threonine-protein phosphatase 2A regulatory subunit B'' subunit alpha isoform X3 [Oopsacas minuta]
MVNIFTIVFSKFVDIKNMILRDRFRDSDSKISNKMKNTISTISKETTIPPITEVWKQSPSITLPTPKLHYINQLIQQWLSLPEVQNTLREEVNAIKNGTSKYLKNNRQSADMTDTDTSLLETGVRPRELSPRPGDGSPPRSPSPFSLLKTSRSIRDPNSPAHEKEHPYPKKICLLQEESTTTQTPQQPIPKISSLTHSTPDTTTLPKFYFPKGFPDSMADTDYRQHITQSVQAIFKRSKDGFITRIEFQEVTKSIGFPIYWKEPLFSLMSAGSDRISFPAFKRMWKSLNEECHDDEARFVYILSGGKKNYLVYEDFEFILQDIVDSHPGLTFLTSHQEFHSRYIQTVVGRIFFSINRSWNGKITTQEIRRSNLLPTIKLLELEDDINKITDYFSYEHFYVIYCKFWELDSDHDLLINKAELSRYADQTLSSRIIDRIFSSCVRSVSSRKQGEDFMTYDDFIRFILAEEDKKHPTSIEYWFRCMDIDGDGVISLYEMEYFYVDQKNRLEELGAEMPAFVDLACQMLDLVKPAVNSQITLSDIKRCKLGYIFYNTFINLDKYLEYEQKDPTARDPDEIVSMTDWEKFASLQYESLIANESENETQDCNDVESMPV